MNIQDVFRGSKFKYKKCGCCGVHVTKKQIFSSFYEGLYSKSNKKSREKVKARKLTANEKWNELEAQGKVVGLDGDWSVGRCSLIKCPE